MTDLREFLNKYVNVNLRRVIVSNARKKKRRHFQDTGASDTDEKRNFFIR